MKGQDSLFFGQSGTPRGRLALTRSQFTVNRWKVAFNDYGHGLPKESGETPVGREVRAHDPDTCGPKLASPGSAKPLDGAGSQNTASESSYRPQVRRFESCTGVPRRGSQKSDSCPGLLQSLEVGGWRLKGTFFVYAQCFALFFLGYSGPLERICTNVTGNTVFFPSCGKSST